MHDYLLALIGGGLLGLAVVGYLYVHGRIAGISGILNGALFAEPADKVWRWLFLLGLVLGGFLFL